MIDWLLAVINFYSLWNDVLSACSYCCSSQPHLLPVCMTDVWALHMYQSLHVQLFEIHIRILAACQHILCLAGVVFVPAKTPVKLEATDDGLDVWIAAVNPQAFQGLFHRLRSPLRL